MKLLTAEFLAVNLVSRCNRAT